MRSAGRRSSSRLSSTHLVEFSAEILTADRGPEAERQSSGAKNFFAGAAKKTKTRNKHRFFWAIFGPSGPKIGLFDKTLFLKTRTVGSLFCLEACGHIISKQGDADLGTADTVEDAEKCKNVEHPALLCESRCSTTRKATNDGGREGTRTRRSSQTRY